MASPFETLNAVNVSGRIEKKGNLSYLSWVWAWGELKKRYPMSRYTVYEDANGCNYFTDGKTCWVKTGVTLVDGDTETELEHIEYLPVMDSRNHSIPLAQVDSFAVNKTIQRSLTKAIARHGLGLYIYAGEDLPEDEKDGKDAQASQPQRTPVAQSDVNPPMCADCQCVIEPYGQTSAQQVAAAAKRKFGRPLCAKCGAEERARIEAGSQTEADQ